MKKVISLALAVIMAFACLPVVFAQDYISNTTLADGTSITDESVIGANAIVTIPEGAVVTVKTGAKLIVNGTLVNNGRLNIETDASVTLNTMMLNTGVVYNDGTVINKANVYSGETGALYTKVSVPVARMTPGFDSPMYTVEVANDGLSIDDLFTYKDSLFGGATLELNKSLFSPAPAVRYVKDGDSLFFKIDFVDPKIDPAKFVVTGNGVKINYDRGVYEVNLNDNPDSVAVSVNYGDYVEKNLIKKIKIMLPYGDGYRTVAFGTTLEEATEMNIEYVYVDYGSTLNFRVEVFEGWQNSDVTVTVGGLDPSAQTAESYVTGPDDYGYYTIKNITDTMAAEGAYEIYVVGVVSDDTQALIMRIMNTIRRIIETIKDIFESFFEMFSGGMDLF